MCLPTLLIIVVAFGTTNSVSGAVMRGHYLDRGDGHVIYWEAEEVEDGVGKVPVMVMHADASPELLSYPYYVPDAHRYRLVYMHQRGWGRSTPRASLVNNTMTAITGDMEAIRELLGIDKWIVTGLSMGSFLALAYGADFPDRCLGLVLRGLDGYGDEYMNYSYNENWGKAMFFPREWKTLEKFSLQAPGDTIVDRFHQLVNDHGREREARVAAAKAWTVWMEAGYSLRNVIGIEYMSDELNFIGASIELHQCKEWSIDPKYRSEVLVKRGAAALASNGVRVRMVVGRQDVLTPPAWSERLRKEIVAKGGRAQVEVVERASHFELFDNRLDEAMERAFNGVLYK